ncbi:MAG TPA: hypothetical protein VF688_04925 [Allosphingosinicella sp.]
MLAAAVLAGIMAALLFLPLPAPALSFLAEKSSPWMLDPAADEGFAAARAGRKFAGLAVQQGLADAFLEARPLPKDMPDSERLARRLVELKPLLISQTELPHAPVTPPVALAGIGWCDGINGFAATVLAREFSQVEIVGVSAADRRSGHSFGRIWSASTSEWLYFDLWTEEVSVFRSRLGRSAEYLFRGRPVTGSLRVKEQKAIIADIYDRAWSGLVHNRLQSTLGGYLFTRLSNVVRHGDRSPRGALGAIQVAASSAAPVDPGPQAMPTPAPAAYVRARLAHIRGDSTQARRGYSEVLAAERGSRSTYGAAARIFIERIDSSREAVRSAPLHSRPAAAT